MSSRARLLPNIPVKHTAVRKVITLTSPTEAKLHAYIAYYTQQQRLDPKQAPSESDTIVAIVEEFLQRDREFGRFLRNGVGQKRSVVDESQTVGMETQK